MSDTKFDQAGMVIDQMMDEYGFCQVPGANVEEHDFACPAIGTGTGVVQSSYTDDSKKCHLTENLTAVADACYANKNCSAFVFQPNGCCTRPESNTRCFTLCLSIPVLCSSLQHPSCMCMWAAFGVLHHCHTISPCFGLFREPPEQLHTAVRGSKLMPSPLIWPLPCLCLLCTSRLAQ